MYNNGKSGVLEKEDVKESQYTKDATNLEKILGMHEDADDSEIIDAEK